MSEKHPGKRRRKPRAVVRDEATPEVKARPARAAKAAKGVKRGKAAPGAARVAGAESKSVEAAMAAAAEIEQFLVAEEAERDRASLAAPPATAEPAWPPASDEDPPWVAAWLRGVGADVGSGPLEASSRDGAAAEASWKTGAPSATDLGDLSGEEPPFDAPSIEELGGASSETATLNCGGEEQDAPASQSMAAPRDLFELDRIAHDPGRLAYLRRARDAARAQALAQLTERRVPQLSRWTIAAGVAAPLLALGAWAALEIANGERTGPGAAALPLPAEAIARDPIADYRRALVYQDAGRVREGLSLLRSAAEAGFAPAQYRLAKIYEHGEGAPRNLQTAREWTERAARAGHCRAMHDVGVYYARGEAVTRNDATAFGWFLQAAELGVVDSQYNLGLLYQHGHGVEANAEHALYWFLVSARQGDFNAIDRAVALATEMAPDQVERAQARARRFEPRRADPIANDEFAPGASCTAILERPQHS
jgi:TPR repeat protein